jgi:hypothetical protein
VRWGMAHVSSMEKPWAARDCGRRRSGRGILGTRAVGIWPVAKWALGHFQRSWARLCRAASRQLKLAGLHCIAGQPVYPFPISPDIFQINTIAPTLKLQNTTSPKFKNIQTWCGGRSIQMEQVSFLD